MGRRISFKDQEFDQKLLSGSAMARNGLNGTDCESDRREGRSRTGEMLPLWPRLARREDLRSRRI